MNYSSQNFYMYKEFILTIEEMNKNLIAQNMNTKRLEVYIND